MFVFLSKFLPLLVYPLGLACLLLLFSFVQKISASVRKWLVLTALLILWLGSNRWVAYGIIYSLERQIKAPETLPSADVIVVLGGGTESLDAPRSSVEINGAGDRVLHAVRLYRQGVAPFVLLSGGNIEWLTSRSTTPAREMEELMVFMGVPQSALIIQDQSQNTAEDVQYSGQIIREKKFERVILVTSAQHMPRSVALFQAEGIEFIPSPTDYTITDAEWKSLWSLNFPAQIINLLPNAGYLSMTTSGLKEYIGILVYSVKNSLAAE
ncbi:MAG: YdcF family protein [Chloroflexota bacterium]